MTHAFSDVLLVGGRPNQWVKYVNNDGNAAHVYVSTAVTTFQTATTGAGVYTFNPSPIGGIYTSYLIDGSLSATAPAAADIRWAATGITSHVVAYTAGDDAALDSVTASTGPYVQWPNAPAGSINGEVQALPPIGGASDDTANLAAQLTAAGTAQVAVGGRVDFVIPLAVYNTTGITLPASVNLKGPGTLKLSAGGSAVCVQASTDNTISGVTFDLNAVTNSVGVEVETASARVLIEGNTFKGAAPAVAGVNIKGAPVDVLVVRNAFANVGYGVLFASTSTADRVAIEANVFTGGNAGDAIEVNTPSGRATNIIASGNTITGYSNNSGSSGIGIGMAHVQYFNIANNVISACGLDGIHVEDASYDGSISGNAVNGCNRSGITVNTTVGVSGTVTTTRRISATNNMVNGCLLTTGTGAIALEGSNAGQDFVLTGNQVRASGRAGATCYAMDLGFGNANVDCAHNICSNTVGTTTGGIRAQALVNSTIGFNRCYDDGTSSQLYGLTLSGAMSGLTLIGNNFTGNATGTINDTSTGTQRQILLAGTADWTMNGGLQAAGIYSQFGLAYLAETLPRWSTGLGNGVGGLASGTIRTQAIWLPAKTINNVGFWSGTTALTRGSNADSHVWFGIADSTRKIVAISADDTASAWAANSAHLLALGASFTPSTAGFYYLFLMVNIGTGGAPALPSMQIVSVPFQLVGVAPILAGTNDTGQTTPLTVNTVLAGLNAVGTFIYGYVT